MAPRKKKKSKMWGGRHLKLKKTSPQELTREGQEGVGAARGRSEVKRGESSGKEKGRGRQPAGRCDGGGPGDAPISPGTD